MFDLKKFLCITICMMLAGTAFAAEFAPTAMEITVPDQVYYPFDGSTLEIDVNIAGVGGNYWLIINTKGQADNINMVQNGFLGWHTVNKIDTTVYISGSLTRGVGAQTVTWDGTNQDGNAVDAGDYDYFIYGYDNVNDRIPACMFIQAGSGWRSHNTFVIEYDGAGNPLANPIITVTVQPTRQLADHPEYFKNGSQHMWPLGGDPEDFNHLMWSNCPIYPERKDYDPETYMFAGGTAHNWADNSIFYHVSHRIQSATATLLKWSFVNNGAAVLDEEWGGWENIEWEKPMPLAIWTEPMSCVTNGEYLMIQDGEQVGVATIGFWNWLYCYDFEGEEIFSKNMPEFFMPDDPSPPEIKNCALLDLEPGNYDNAWFLGTMGCCMHEFIDASVLVAEGDADEADYLRWRNGQGDFYYDVYWQADADVPWGCLNNAEWDSHRIDTVQVDAQGINIIYATFIGAFSHGVQTQDGTSLLGAGLMAYSDDGVPDEGGAYRGGGKVIDNGSAFDGMYTTRPLIAEGGGGFGRNEVWYVANASAGGMITDQLAVEEDAAAAFAVSQNSPNPFNPTTTINFTLPVDGNVSVEVFNVAGQKVDTLVNDYMNAGQHNVVWDASGFSNGVYFYTVKSGEFAKTMKMTLLK
jgi:hypothetical protein